MTSTYKTLLGLSDVDADVIVAERISTQDLKAENMDVNNAIINKLTIPNGGDGLILTSDADSLASWKPNMLTGDVTGLATDKKLTIPNGQDGYLLTSDKDSKPSWKFNESQWMGNWDNETAYKKNNLVTHNHTMYRAVVNNANVDPEAILEPMTYNLYTEPNYSSPPYIQDLNNKYGSYWLGLRFATKMDCILTGCQYPIISGWDRYMPFYYVRVYENGGVILTHTIPKSEMVNEGWQRITFVTPINIVKGNTYEVAYEATEGLAYQVGNQMNNVDPDVATIFSLLTNVNSVGTQNLETFANEAYLMDVFIETIPKYWEVVLDERPGIVYETKSQAITNKTNIETQNATVFEHLVLPNLLNLNPDVYNLKYLVLTEDNYTRRIADLYAPVVGAYNSFKFKAGAGANKVLACIDESGSSEWRDLVQVDSVLMTGDVTGSSNANTIYTLANGTINVSDLVTTSNFNSLLPSLGGDVTGPYGSTKVNTLAGGTISVYSLLTTSGSQYVLNKLFNNTNAFIGTSNNSRLLFGLEESSSSTTTQLKLKSTMSRVIYLPDADDTLIGKNTTDSLMNKTLNDASNNVFANGLRSGNLWSVPLSGYAPTTGMILAYNGSVAIWSLPTFAGDVTGGLNSSVVNTLAGGTINVNNLVTLTGSQNMTNKTMNDATNNVYANGIRTATWTVPVGGSAPVTGNVMYYNGSNAVWVNAASLITLAGDVTGPINNTVAVKATTDFAVGRILTLSNLDRIKKIVLWDGGVATDPADHRFFGLGITSSQQRYQVPAGGSHVFFASTSATASNELARISGDGDLSIARTISSSNGDRIKKVVLYEGGTATNSGDHRYNGLGTFSAQLRYHVNTTTDSHVFYAATSATASNELARISGGGDLTVARTISTGNGLRNKKIVLYDEGTLTDTSDHRFMGLGYQAGQMRYQLPTTSQSHVFYGALSGTASNELARIRGSGDLHVLQTISASNGTRLKKIVVHEEGNFSDVDDHRFHGLGVQPYQMRYQVASTVNNHVFYAATSNVTSNELFKISGDGNSVANGVMFSRTSCADSWRPPTIQGAWMGWNRAGGSGRTTFANQMGLGYGGWEWVNYYNNNQQDPPGDPAMSLDRNGNLNIRGKLSINNSIFYSEYTHVSTWVGPWNNAGNQTVYFTRTGRNVTARFVAFKLQENQGFSIAMTNSGYINFIPMEYGSNVRIEVPMLIIENNTTQMGIFTLDSNGVSTGSSISIQKMNKSSFTGICGWGDTCVSWSI